MNIVTFRQGKDLRQSEEYAKFMEKIGWNSFKVPNHKSQITIFIKKFGIITLAKIRRPLEINDWNKVKNILNKFKVNVCRIDPEIANIAEYKKQGFKLSRDQMVATKTLLLDLTPSLENIQGEFKTETRRKLKQCSKFNVQCSINNPRPDGRGFISLSPSANKDSASPDLTIGVFRVVINLFDEFYEILKKGYKEIDVWCPPKSEYNALIESFGKKCFCVTIDDKAGCLVIIHKAVAEYYYASATSEGKSENLPYFIAWEAIKEAKLRGAKIWDWNGLYDDRFPEKRYLGFSFFKKRFGGMEYDFPGGFLGWRILGGW